MPGNKAILQPTDIAVALDISPWTAQKLCRNGTFPHAFRLGEVGSRWRIPCEDLEAFMQRRREATRRQVPKRADEPVIYTLPRTEVF